MNKLLQYLEILKTQGPEETLKMLTRRETVSLDSDLVWLSALLCNMVSLDIIVRTCCNADSGELIFCIEKLGRIRSNLEGMSSHHLLGELALLESMLVGKTESHILSKLFETN